MTVRVVTAAQAAARDAAAIAAGIPSRALMRCAGMAAAAEIARRYAPLLADGVAVFAGPGNNGGDAWVVAGALAAAGVRVRVAEGDGPKTPDAVAERAAARPMLREVAVPSGGERVVVDGVLGTGATGAPRGTVAQLVARVNAMRDGGATVVALDVPSGVDATTGVAAGEHVVADLTLTFGTMKRGLLLHRRAAGRVAVLDIGLGGYAALADGAPELVDAPWVAARVPPIAVDAHKGTRRRVAIVGGGVGMAGAAALAARGAFRSGVGLVRLVVAPASVGAVQAAVPEAIAAPWPAADAIGEALASFDAVALGPGLGRSAETRRLVEGVLAACRGPVVLDADAINVFEGDADALGTLLAGRPALLTPHPAEFARLSGATVREVLDARFEAAPALARRLGACVLLKGVPTVVAAADGRGAVSAAGAPTLAVAGSGDVLTGIAITLLAQTGDAFAAATCAAWTHGRAGELAADAGHSRGATLDDVLVALGSAWPARGERPLSPVLFELAAVGAGGAR